MESFFSINESGFYLTWFINGFGIQKILEGALEMPFAYYFHKEGRSNFMHKKNIYTEHMVNDDRQTDGIDSQTIDKPSIP